MNTIRTRNLSPAELQEVARRVRALRRLSKVSGFNTTRPIVSLLKPLTTDDLIALGEELKLKPKELPESALAAK